MVRYFTLISVTFVLLLASCGSPENLPTPDEILPKGYSEQVVPQDFVNELGFDFRTGELWYRCFDCKDDWDGLNNHILSVLGPQGYEESTSKLLGVMNKSAGWSGEVNEVMQKVIRTYSSQLGFAHIMLMDLKELKQMGAEIPTSGDFIVIAAIDDLKNY